MRVARSRTAVLWAALGLALVAVVALAVTGHLNANVLPQTRPPIRSVQCYDADGDPSSGWSVSAAAAPSAGIDPVGVCDALFRDHTAAGQMDQIATRQRALGRACVTFRTSDGGTWYLTGLTSADGTYSASGGPVPGKLPVGEVSAPAPLAGVAPRPSSTVGCVELPTVTWNASVPPMSACYAADAAVAVYIRAPAAGCASQ